MVYTVLEICERYSVREGTVLGWIHAGELAAINVGRAPGKIKPRWRISEKALQEFEAGRAGPKKKLPRLRKQKAAVGLRTKVYPES